MKLLDIVLNNITGPFEGGGFDNTSSNFDDEGFSGGILQWCYGQGSLQKKILQPYLAKYGSIDNLKIFPSPIIDASAKMTGAQGHIFAKDSMNYSKGIFHKNWYLKPEWEAAWKKFLLTPEVVQLQKAACDSLDRDAKILCQKWDLKSVHAYCWMFDILTQNGSLLGIQKPEYDLNEADRVAQLVDLKCRNVWNKLHLEKLNKEQIILLIASYRRATKSRSEYMNDVFSRKGTIALGKGVVHGGLFDLQYSYSIVTSDSIS